MLRQAVSRAGISALPLLLLLPPTAAAQEPEPQPSEVFREEIAVSEVLLDVLVTDKRGNVIVGLGPDDFMVEEDGRALEVRSVAFYSNLRPLDGSEAVERSDRYFILFFHDQTLAMSALVPRQLETARWAKRWIKNELLRNDHLAVLAYDARLKVYQDFTTDKKALVRAVDEAVRGKPPLENWPSRLEVATEEGSPSLLVNLPKGRELDRRTRKVQQALAEVARAASYITGRKNLLLFSVGFGNVNDFGTWQPDIRYYPDMEQSLNDGNVAVYSIDLLPTSRGGAPQSRAINDALSSISSDTGGHYYFNFITPLEPLREVSDDNNGYYLLSYTSPYEAGTSGYRQVKVTTRNPEFEVRARRGYLYGSG